VGRGGAGERDVGHVGQPGMKNVCGSLQKNRHCITGYTFRSYTHLNDARIEISPTKQSLSTWPNFRPLNFKMSTFCTFDLLSTRMRQEGRLQVSESSTGQPRWPSTLDFSACP